MLLAILIKEYLKKNGFQIEDSTLDSIITVSKKIGNDFLVELSAHGIERDIKENEELRKKHINELKAVLNDLELKTVGKEPILRNSLKIDFLRSLFLNSPRKNNGFQ